MIYEEKHMGPGIQLTRRVQFALLAVTLLASAGSIADTFVPDEVNAAGPDAGKIVDPEFDALQSQFCWIAEGFPTTAGDESLWVGRIDPQTGLFDPPDGQFARADFGSIVGVKNIGNGCEWVFTDNGAHIAYSKLDGGTTIKDRHIAGAVFTQGYWAAGILEDSLATYAPIGSLDRGDPTPGVAYQGFVAPDTPGNRTRALYVRVLNDPTSEQMIPTTDEFFTPGARWIPGTNSVIFTRPMGRRDARQVFSYDMDSMILEQLTDSEAVMHSASMWNAPEYGGELIFLALEDEEYLGIYRLLDLDGDGTKTWTQSHIVDPPAEGTYIWSPEPFVANGRSYIVMTTSTSSDQGSREIPTDTWLAGIDPDQPFYRQISDSRELVRKDPEAVVFAGDQPLVRSGSPEDFSLTESLTISTTGQLIAVGSSAEAPAGGRNAVLVFPLPPLESGLAIDEADFGVKVVNGTSGGSMAADLWALSISPNLNPSQYFLEENNDSGKDVFKIADNLLTGATLPGTRVTLGESQKLALAAYITTFYEENPGYNGGYNLYLRLNPDIDGGTENKGWSIAASDNVPETGPTLTLKYSRSQDVAAASQDFTLTEDFQELTGFRSLQVGSTNEAESSDGRNAILAFDLPTLLPGYTIERATLSMAVLRNLAVPGVNADLWAVAIQPTGDELPKSYLEYDSDPDSLHVKVANNLLTQSTPVNQRLSLNGSQATVLGEYLGDFYEQSPPYQGGKSLYLRLNPDADSGTSSGGWYVYSAEGPMSARPVLRLAIKSPEKVWVYISIGGEMHRLDTGL